MATTMTLADFYNYVRDNRKRIADVYREIEEIQYQFNDLHARQMAEWEKLISTYAPLLLKGEDVPPELQQPLVAQEQTERQAIQDAIARLQKEIAEKRSSADGLVQLGQKQVAALREENPILNQQEEELKARRASVEGQVQRLDLELKQTGCFPIGWLTHFFQRRRLRRQREQLVENLTVLDNGIRVVREKWQTRKKELQQGQADLQSKWQALSVEISQFQARLDDLETNIDELSKRNAAQNLLGDLQEVPVSAGPWRDRLAPLVELSHNKSSYEAGLTTVAETLGLLKGLGEGMDRFVRSVATVYEEQGRYKLPMLKLTLSDAVTSLHAVWPDFQAKVKDEKYLGTHPLEFSQRVQEVVRQRLQEAPIKSMFEDMGSALTKATKQWR
jgi:predicted  nucleic acid-binding Zn-ribbon protein